MIPKFLVITIVFLTLLQINAQSGQKDIPTIGINQISQGKLYKVDNFKSYHLINVSSIDKKYLFFSLKTQKVYEDFNLSLTIYKEGTQSPLVRCLKQEVDSCYLAKQQVFLNESLFIVVQCDSGYQLEYKIRTYWSDLEHLKVGSETRFIFSQKQQNQIYHLELQGMQFKQLRITIRPETKRYPFDKIKMYGTFGAKSNPSASYHDFKSFPMWQDAQGVYLYRSEIKDLSINLILYGETKTVYSLRCEIVNKTHGDFGINDKIYEYMEKQQQYTYHLKFKDDKNNYFYDNYIFRFAVFSGNLDIKFFKDEYRRQEITDFVNYAYMGDVQYAFSNKTALQQKMPNGLYVKVVSTTRISTYMLEFQGRGKSESLELHQHIYQFLSVQKTQLAYIKVSKFIDNNTDKKFTIVFTDVAVIGRIGIEFRVCKKDLNQCMGLSYAQNSDKILSEIKQVGTKVTYTVQLSQSMFSAVNIAEQKSILVVAMTNMSPQGSSFSAVEYNVGNRPEFLRQNKPIQSYVRKNEVKIYKYVCQDPSIKKVKIHINKISGSFDMFALRRIPKDQQLKNPTFGKVSGSVVEFSDRLLQDPVLLVINGIDSAIYSIVVQTETNQDSELSYITLSEDVEFKMKIASNKYEIFQIVPISASIYFDYKATGPVHVCLLDEEMICKQKNIPVLQNQGKVVVPIFNTRKAYVKVRNPSNRVVQVKSIFHSRQEDHCELVKMSHLASQVLTEGKCLYTVIDTPKDFEVMLIHEEYGQFQYKTVICSQLVNIPRKKFDEQRFFISKQLLQKNCQGSAEYTFTFVVVGNISRIAEGKFQTIQKLNAKYIIQFVNSVILIPDGVGYHSTEVTSERQIKRFSYNLMNIVNTSILVTTTAKLRFLVKVIQSSQRDDYLINVNDYHFKSPSVRYYFLDSIHLTIQASQIAKYTCKQCELLIFLFSDQTVGQLVDYTIQVTQNFQVLEEGKQKKNYLTQNSKAFYSYNIKSEGQVLVELSDNNQNCAELYVSRSEYPDENNYDKKSFDGEIIYENKKKEPSTLYVSVKARVNCAYSVGASLIKGSVKIKKLQRGVMSPLTLKKGEVRYFTFKHASQISFKILSLHKYGNIEFYSNRTTPQLVGQKLKNNNLNYVSFVHKSQQKNRLTLSPSNIEFCRGCFYVVAAVATRPTDSSIFLADEQTKIPISEDKVINDILPTLGSYTKGEFYPLQNGVIQVKIHSGKLSVQVEYKEQSFSNTFQKINTKETYKFSLKYATGFYGTASVTFKALAANTVYSLRIYSEHFKNKEQATRTQTIVNPSQPNYFYIDGVKQTVLKGYLKSKQDKIFISFFMSDKQLLRFMNLTATLDGKPADISRDTTRNVLSIGFLEAQNFTYQKGVPYELVFSLQNQTMSMIAMQSQQTSLLPENLQVLVSGVQTYDIYPQGQFLLDIFQCRGSASVSYGKSLSRLQKQKQKVLDVIGMPDQPHAVKINQGFTNTLVRITSNLSLVRWLPINKQQETGLGYYLYKAGTLKYDSVFGNIEFEVQPLSRTTQKTKTKINDIRYNLYISSSEQDLNQASLCERYLPASVLEYRSIHQQIFTSSFRFSIDKNKLSEKYKQSENLFSVIVADLTLIIPDGSKEYYRFVYNNQEIPKQIFTPSKLQSFHFASLSIFLLLLIATLLLLAWLCTKVFVPMIGRLRNRMLVEEHGLQTSKDKDKDIEIKEQQIQPPLSSDRQGIIQIETGPSEQAMS